jgi:glutamate-1-semialdehyde 2,1-aminomutase
VTRSDELFARAQRVLPGGVNSPVRAMRAIGRDPIFISSAKGANLTDVDGNDYIDYVCSWGPLILGHADPDVISAIERTIAYGTSFGAPTELEVELAELVSERISGCQMLRMTSSGTEAAMSAVRLARAATGRTKLLKFAGAYHGHSDAMLVAAGSGVATLGVPGSPGVPEQVAEQTVVVPWNDLDAVTAAFADHDFAAIIAEPCPANMGLVPPAPGFLQQLRSLADASGALLIFDEVISGFRVAAGGFQQLAEVTPDLTVFGKVIGGGLPAAAYGGKRELMQRIAPVGDVYQAGTLSGNPLAMAAGLATLKKLDSAAYAELARLTDLLANGMRQAAADAGVRVSVVSECGLLTVFFSERPVQDFSDATNCDLGAHAGWCRALIERGVNPPPSQYEAWFPSLAHDDATIAATIEAAAAAFAEVAR